MATGRSGLWKKGPRCIRTTVNACTVPRPLASNHWTSVEPHAGQNVRGYQMTVEQRRHRGSTSFPAAVADQNAAVSDVTRTGADGNSFRCPSVTPRAPG